MLYSALIAKLRVELKDFGKIQKEVFDGDSSTLNFPLTYIPVKDDSYTVKVGGVTKEETTDYSIDKDTGVITFATAPAAGSDNVEVSYQSVKMRDGYYIELINDAIDHFRWKFWKEAEDTTTFTTVKDQYNYDLSSLTGILYLLNCWYKTSSGATVWTAIQVLTNWKYMTRQQKLFVDPPFSPSGLPMKFRYLKSFTKGTVVSDDLDIPDEWILPYKYYIKARFFELFVSEKISETAAITTLPTYSPAQVVVNIVEYYYKKAEETANRIAPKLPVMPVRQISEGVAM